MRKLLLALLLAGVLIMPVHADGFDEWPNLYYGPDFNITEETWGSTAASDLIGYWAFSVNIALCDDGAKGTGISVDVLKVAKALKLDYYWGDKVRTKIGYIFARDFDREVNTHRIMLTAIQIN